MSNLITLGCSFSSGEGCYDMDLYNSYKVSNFDELPESYYQKNKEYCLKNSIGRHIQNEFGFRDYYNYAHAGSSNLSQVFKFFNTLPPDGDNTVIWQITMFDRKPMPHSYMLDDSYLKQNKWVNEYYREVLTKLNTNGRSIEENEIMEVSLYINILKEFCRAKNWNFYIWFWNNGNDKKMIQDFPNFRDIVIPFGVPSLNTLKSYVKITGDNHPNEEGYKKVANNLIKSIRENFPNFREPKETPISFKSIGREIRK